jgi:hypothetical protein
VKINWDASVNRQQKQMGAGVVARDSDGGVLAMHCITKNSITFSFVYGEDREWRSDPLFMWRM